MTTLTQSRISRAIKQSLAVAILGSVPAANVALAAEDGANDDKVIQIVGSQIRRADIEGATPVTRLTREDLDRSGASTIAEALLELPIVGAGNFTTATNSQDSTSLGGSGVSFRGLGADTTLILINGRRITVSPFADSISTAYVDLNTIPMAAVEEIQVLKDGASAIYGSDAMAGVINIVMKKDFQGAELSVGYGNTTDTDSSEKSASLVWGTSNQDTSVTLIMDYFDRNALYLRDRSYSASADQSANAQGDDARSSAPEWINWQDPNTGVFSTDPGCPADRITDLGASGEICRFNYNEFITSIPSAERFGVMASVDHQINNDMSAFMEFQYQLNQGMVAGAPSPAFNLFTMDAANPNNPTGLDLTQFRRRFVENGPRVYNFDNDNTRLLAGLRGSFELWDWEVAYTKSRNVNNVNSESGFINSRLAQEAIDNGIWNPFGGLQSSGYNYFDVQVHRKGVARTDIFDAKLSGVLTEMDHGPLTAAFGYEYRDESIRDTPDEQFAAGEIVGTENTAANGSRDQYSVFAEFVMPVTEDLDIQAALRYEDYSDFGTTTNPKVSARYKATEDMMIRASWGTGFRAPSLVELGLGPTNESPELIDVVRCPLTNDPLDCGATEYIALFVGNPDLDAEESESFNVGMVYQLTDDMSMSVDYWSYDLENTIEKDTQNLLNLEAQGALPAGVVVRQAPTAADIAAGAPGRISLINDGYQNIGTQETDGIDVNFTSTFDTDDMGDFKFVLNWTHVMSFDEKRTADAPTVDLNGEWQRPENRFTAALDWTDGDWSATLVGQFIGEYKDDFNLGKTRTVDDWMTYNLQVRYMGIQDSQFTVGIDNLTDEEPPYSASDFRGYDNATHSSRGQFIYARYSMSF